MPAPKTVLWLVSICLLITAHARGQAQPGGRDWFVRAAATGGDGSRARPFGDPWEALEKCEAQDRIHVTEGKYYGRLGAGTWVIPFDGVELVGGYDAEWKERDPWRRLTLLLWDKESKNWPKDVRLGSQGRNVVVDGIVIDMKDQNGYVDEACTGRTEKGSETAMRFTQPAIVRNCVVVNPGLYAIACAGGSVLENNLIVNALIWGVSVTSSSSDKATTTITHNTILYCWDLNAPGKGGYGGAAIASRSPVAITDNILAFCDNSAIYLPAAPDKVSITGNVFWKNRFANLKCEVSGQTAIADDKSMDLLEEVGLKAHAGNTVRDPELALDAQWLGLAAKRDERKDAPPPAKAEPPRWGEEKPVEVPKGIAPAWSLERTLALLAPRAAGIGAGARIVPLVVKLADTAAAKTPAKTYEQVELTSWCKQPEPVHGKSLAMRVARGSVANITGMPDSYDQKRIAGVFLFDPEGKGERVTGFYLKGSNAERVCDELRGRYQGSGQPETLYLVRGTAYAVKHPIKGAFFIESIERYEAPAAAARPRPQGRDWFVRAGAAGGDGSREQPFKDPFQPLERCEAGDTIHVAEGEYVGRLKSGVWRVDMPYIAIVGGYDAGFTERNPWRHPTRLLCPPDFKGSRGGYTLQGEADHTGTVLDGLIFDKRTNNRYTTDGSLDAGRSDTTEHVWLARPECVIRNCVFLNGALGALRVANGQVLENNVFVNHVTQTVDLQKGHTTTPAVFRRNTVAFAWDLKRPGQGMGANGHLLHLEGDARAVIEDNVFAYADNDAIRLDADPREVVLSGNVFAHNLWSNLQQPRDYNTFNDRNWDQVQQLGFKKFERNALQDPQLSVEPAWLARHAAARTKADAPSKAKTEPAPATGNPFDDASTSRPADAPAAAAGGRNPFADAPAKPEAAGGAGASFAPAYDWQHAVALFPKDSACTAGARAADQRVAFTGIARPEPPAQQYAETAWAVARDRTEWEKLAGQRVQLRVAIRNADNQYFLPEVTEAEYQCFLAGGPEGTDSGLPLRCYVKKGTRFERALRQAKGYGPGKPEEWHWLKGIARGNRQLVVESIEKAE